MTNQDKANQRLGFLKPFFILMKTVTQMEKHYWMLWIKQAKTLMFKKLNVRIACLLPKYPQLFLSLEIEYMSKVA